MADALRARADANGVLSFADFCEQALFHPQEGYYVRKRKRVGLMPEADFYTASSVGPIFGKLVAEAAAKFIAPNDPADFTLVEIGAEPEAGVFEKLYNGQQSHSDQQFHNGQADAGGSQSDIPLPAFANVLTLSLGDAWQWPQKAVLFANELLDAQPFHRLQMLDGRWREWGVRCDEQGHLSEVLLDDFSEQVATKLAPTLPRNQPEGWRLDISLAAEALLARLLSSNWQGAFLLFDYGKYWQDLLTGSPTGTARAYRNHQLSTDLLATPGQQDLTCHVCWDRLERIANEYGFANPRLERQEAFFMHHSTDTISHVIGRAPQDFDPERQALTSLLHPAHLGGKFQVLHARRL